MTPDQVQQCLDLLEAVRELPVDHPDYLRIEQAAAHLRKTAKRRRSVARRRAKADHDRSLVATTGLATHRHGPAAHEGDATMRLGRRCYVCKEWYTTLHPWYDRLCVACGDRGFAERDRPLDLSGRRALVTGGRIKIGFATALRLLRAGARVEITTRFGADARDQYAAEADHADWWDRLTVHTLDFRHLDAVTSFLDAQRDGPPLDVLINNAAQSVWHPPDYYRRLWDKESHQHRIDGPNSVGTRDPLVGSLLPQPAAGPHLLDLQRRNSWLHRLAEIEPLDMIEVSVVNGIVPFLFCSRLHDPLCRSVHPDRYIINVTAVEGQFDRFAKRDLHPHTNMAKAGLNMLTCTSAADYAKRGIYMVSVDPGWMSHEIGPVPSDVDPPLQAVDCAARVVQPIAEGIAGRPLHGILLKDFVEVPW